jgi:hypothetical protein
LYPLNGQLPSKVWRGQRGRRGTAGLAARRTPTAWSAGHRRPVDGQVFHGAVPTRVEHHVEVVRVRVRQACRVVEDGCEPGEFDLQPLAFGGQDSAPDTEAELSLMSSWVVRIGFRDRRSSHGQLSPTSENTMAPPYTGPTITEDGARAHVRRTPFSRG